MRDNHRPLAFLLCVCVFIFFVPQTVDAVRQHTHDAAAVSPLGATRSDLLVTSEPGSGEELSMAFRIFPWISRLRFPSCHPSHHVDSNTPPLIQP